MLAYFQTFHRQMALRLPERADVNYAWADMPTVLKHYHPRTCAKYTTASIIPTTISTEIPRIRGKYGCFCLPRETLVRPYVRPYVSTYVLPHKRTRVKS